MKNYISTPYLHSLAKYSTAALSSLILISNAAFAQGTLGSDLSPQVILDRSIGVALQKMKSVKHIELASAGHADIHTIIALYDNDQKLQKQASLCSALTALPTVDLTFFSEAMDEHQNSSGLKPCIAELQNRIDGYWVAQKNKLPNQGGLFTEADEETPEPFNVIQVDLTNSVPGPYNAKQYIYKDKQITLTFDDGPRAKTTPTILDTLARYKAKVVFFNLGNNATVNPSLSRRVLNEGHTLASHTYNHPDEAAIEAGAPRDVRYQDLMQELSNAMNYDGVPPAMTSVERAQAEITTGHSRVFEATGMIAPFFRFPYGSDSDTLKEFLAEKKIFSFRWNMDSEDWNTPDVTKLIAQVKAMILEERHGTILMHDIQPQTMLALPSILDFLHDEGFTLIQPVYKNTQTMTVDVPIVKDQANAAEIMQKAALSSKKRLVEEQALVNQRAAAATP